MIFNPTDQIQRNMELTYDFMPCLSRQLDTNDIHVVSGVHTFSGKNSMSFRDWISDMCVDRIYIDHDRVKLDAHVDFGYLYYEKITFRRVPNINKF